MLNHTIKVVINSTTVTYQPLIYLITFYLIAILNYLKKV
jgi:hypothetical protein